MRFSFLKSGLGGEPALVYLRVPGCDALAFEHFLRAVFCVIDGGAALAQPAVSPDRLDAQTVLADYFDESHPLAPALRGEAFRFTAIGDPIHVQTAVYRHLVANRPELIHDKPARFGSLERFLLSRKNEVSRQLAAALGKRNCSVGDFAHVAVSEEPGRSIRQFSIAIHDALKHASASRSVIRTRALLQAAIDGPISTKAAGQDGIESCAAEFRRKNPLDCAFYDAARRALDGPSRPFTGRRSMPPVSSKAEPVFVFNHLPKCYGTSVRVHFANGFSLLEDHTEFFGRPDVVRDAPCETSRLGSDVVLCGHFCDGDYRLPMRYPEVWEAGSRFRIFTFVRDPLDMAISNYRHVVRTDPRIVERDPEHYATIETYLLSLHNPMAYRLGCDRTNWRDVVDRHFFVGAAERTEAGIPRLLDRMEEILRESGVRSESVDRALAGISRLRGRGLPHANAGGRPNDGQKISGKVRNQFMKNHEVDLLIHEHAVACDGVGGGAKE